MENDIIINWEPQPRQLVCLRACGLSYPFDGEPLHPAVADIVGYGGSAGGGKTDTLLQIGLVAGLHYNKLNIGYFRREFPQLEGPGGAIMRSRELMGHFAKYNEQKHRWTLPVTDSIMQFCHASHDSDVFNYQSQQFDILLIDEVTQFSKDMVKYLLTRNRATVEYESFRPFAAFGTNPGNVGHQYFKDEFVSIGPAEQVNTFVNEVGRPEKHIFIPSRLHDNEILVRRDPNYENRVANTELNKKMLLEGSWDVFAGQAFAELSRAIHIIPDIPIEKHWQVFGAYDHGFNHPFSFGVYATNDDGEVYRIAERKGRLKRIDEIAQIMEEATKPFGGLTRLSYIVAGHDCWSRQKDGGPTIAEKFLKTKQHILLRKANIDRIQGSNQVRTYVAYKGKNSDGSDGEPLFYFFESACKAYDTLASMIFDTNGPHPEDVLKRNADENGHGGDDEYDEIRYGLMSRPRPGLKKQAPPPANSVDGYLRKKRMQEALRQEYVGY